MQGVLFATRTEAYDAISDYIDNYYNARRRHSSIDLHQALSLGALRVYPL